MRVLVVNAGSSTLKLTLLDDRDRILAAEEIEAHRSRFDALALTEALSSPLGQADAVGHRIVHGGQRYREAVRVDNEVKRELNDLTDLAPLHQPKSLQALQAVGERLPSLPAVACFDTAFHATLPAAASTYALPGRWREELGLRRYGFHGLSHSWVARRTAELLGRNASNPARHDGSSPLERDAPEPPGHDTSELRIVSCHLGAGASLCAIQNGISVDTTMGFTPLEGLVMATRSGSVDPGLLMWLIEHERLSAAELSDALEHESGLLGLCGDADMRMVLERSIAGEGTATLALDVYLHRLRGAIAAMAASMEGLDVLAFTGGVGEHSPEIRSRAAAGFGFLGVCLDEDRNREASADAEIGAEGAAVRSLVLTAREDLEIARQVRAVIGG